MNDLTSGLRELANVDAHSAASVGSPFVPGGVPHAFYPPLSGSGIELRVVRDGSPARRLRINTSRCTFGSGEGCTVRLSDSSLQPLHAVIVREADRVLIRSESTTIEVNGQPTSESLLDCGDVFRLGSYLFETLSLPQASSEAIQDQAQRLRFMTAPDPELDAARLREQEVNQRLAEALQRAEQAQSQLAAADGVVAELQQQIAALNQQAELLRRAAVAEAQQQLDAARDDAKALRQQLDAAQQQRDQALRERGEALQQRDQALAKRSDAIDSEQAAQAKLRQLNQQIQQLQQAQAAAESEKLNELSLEAYMSRLLQQMERSPAAPAPRSTVSQHLPPQPPEPQPTSAADEVLVAEVAAEPIPVPSSAAAACSASAAESQQVAAQQPQQRTGSSPLAPPPVPPRPSPWNNVLQVAVVVSCSLIFLYCGQRNPDLQVVWYTASALAGGLVLFAVYDLLAKSLRRNSSLPLTVPGQLASRAVRP